MHTTHIKIHRCITTWLALFTLTALPPAIHAASVYNVSESSALNSTADWSASSGGSSGATVPTYLDTAIWDVSSGSGSVALGANLSWNGITYGAVGSATTITSDGNTLTLGVGGINMSSAAQNFTLNCGLTLGAGGQSWNVASGQTLTLGGTINRAVGGGTVDFPGSGTVTGSGISGLTQLNGIIPWATVAGVDWATTSGGNIAAYNGYTTFPTTAASGSASVNYQVTGTTQAGTGNTLANSVKVTAGLTLSATRTLTLTSGGSLLVGTGGSISSAGDTNISSSGELILNVASGVSLTTLRAESIKAVTLVKSGSGNWTSVNQNELTNVSQTIRIAQGDLTVAGSTAAGNNVVNCQYLIIDAGASFGLTGSPGNHPSFGGYSSWPIAISGSGTIGGGGTQSPYFGAYCTFYPGGDGTYGTLTTGSGNTARFLGGCSFGFDLSSNPSGLNDLMTCLGAAPFTITNNSTLNFAINPMDGTLSTASAYTLINGSAGTPSVGSSGVTYPITFPNGGDPGAGNRSITYSSSAKSIILTVTSTGSMPSISGLSGPTVSAGATSGNLSYTGTANSPTDYSITWSPAAITAGFVNVGDTANAFNAGAGTIGLIIPAGAAAGTYTGYLITSVGSIGGGNPSSYQQPFTVTVQSGTPPPPSPVLTASYSAGVFALSWPVQTTNFAVQFTTNIAAPVAWTPLTSTVVTNNSTVSVTISNPAGVSFFRLLEQP